MRIWRIRHGKFARAFAPYPKSIGAWLSMYWRGWRPFNLFWYSKPNRNIRARGYQ